jgi:DNA (cytosine-5)-methyltransferase 1
MWREMARIIHEVRPRFVFVENSPMLTSRGLGRVLADLAEMGFDAKWGVLGANSVGAPHRRDRIWIVGKVGNTNNNGQIATKVSTSIAQGSDTSAAWPKQASQFTRPSEQYAELANTNSKSKYGESNSSSNNEPIEKQRERTGNFVGSGCKKNVADPKRIGQQGQGKSEQPSDTTQNGDRKASQPFNVRKSSFWAAEPDVGRVADGVAARVDRLKAIGNGQVSEVARRAWEILSDQR